MSEGFIEIRHLRKSYGEVDALIDVDLTLDEGKTAAIIGSSGCGKSTFLRCLNLLETPTSGSLRINGDVIVFQDGKLTSGEETILRFRKSMAMVFQTFDLFPHMTALKNVALAPTVVNGMSREEATDISLKLLERVGLKNKASFYPNQLSGGQAQRVAIARALAMKPRVLLFDEATSALDPELVGEVLAVIKDLASEGRTMIVVTHELAFARDVADELFFFERGRVMERGDPKEIMSNPQTDRLHTFLKRFRDPLQ